ncbi:hypothetical protein SERLA73DRAFT_191792 [Serpula lacrymans var. lacrymans S7.3]|uniref:Pre-mRNA-splicing factor SPF27 n=2 Tax=Serpula lacrymans var. lacrymans TaxID=341189 RepID=F8QIA5_SERL3|nr:uncharacterized protein SERLADRAFT_454699 [Serpula lacrymans var. lacrymans S7.9]EGN91958.1 hypothetical protein SERLA73DRAFT_191792 [Serpula lacrymans var. lacrymans S7.3]EGO30379.1 hypothetical protein SERLADRAFT_454699 [Serpula lacrymans var. lacrymans S7.9]
MTLEGWDRISICDSLPYYDTECEKIPYLTQKVDLELASEFTRLDGLHSGVPPADLFPRNATLLAELTRIETYNAMPPPLDLEETFAQLNEPLRTSPTSATDQTWQEVILSARVYLEHQRMRQLNLALVQTYGSNSWLTQNYPLQRMAEQAEKDLKSIIYLTSRVNQERIHFQTRIGEQLATLEARWTDLVSKVLQVQMSNVSLEIEIQELKQTEFQIRHRQ